jgi:hypothetical protein
MKELTDRDIEVLLEAEYFVRRPESATYWVVRSKGAGWFKTGDVGGRNGSHHSQTLKKLARRGLIETTKRPKGSKAKAVWKLTESGIALARDVIEKRRQARQKVKQEGQCEPS